VQPPLDLPETGSRMMGCATGFLPTRGPARVAVGGGHLSGGEVATLRLVRTR